MATLHNSTQALASLSIDRTADQSLSRQVCEAVRDLITTGRLVPGTKMPSSREFAYDISVSRTTIISAFDQLIAEGYLAGRVGSGTFVEDFSRQVMPNNGPIKKQTGIAVSPSSASKVWPLSPSASDMESFPRKTWARAAARGQRRLRGRQMFDFPDGGHDLLREQIAIHVNAMRGVACSTRQVIVTSGLEENLSLICGALLPSGAQLITEDPGHPGTRKFLKRAGVTPSLCQIDAGGLNVRKALQSHAAASGALVTPTRQFPLGMPLRLDRRLLLVDWAKKNNRWIIEDDYDCEFRFHGQPLQSIYSLDRGQRTIYLGSLSKVLFPSLRVGFLVAPENVVDQLISFQNQWGGNASILAQAALAEFMAAGHLSVHIRRMRRLYARRYEHLLSIVKQRLGHYMTPDSIDGGFHFIVRLDTDASKGISDVDVAEEIARSQVGALPLSRFCDVPSRGSQGLLLGFSGTSNADADRAVETLRVAIEKIDNRSTSNVT